MNSVSDTKPMITSIFLDNDFSRIIKIIGNIQMEPRAMRVFTNRYEVDGRKEDQTNIV